MKYSLGIGHRIRNLACHENARAYLSHKRRVLDSNPACPLVRIDHTYGGGVPDLALEIPLSSIYSMLEPLRPHPEHDRLAKPVANQDTAHGCENRAA